MKSTLITLLIILVSIATGVAAVELLGSHENTEQHRTGTCYKLNLHK